MPSRCWDAETYDRVSTSMELLGRQVIQRMGLRGDETAVDAGCGTGRVTEVLAERLPRGRVIAVDSSAEMVAVARRRLGARAEVRRGDLLELALEHPVDAVLCTATLHWIDDHDRLFGRLHGALRPGGLLAAQCGARGNVDGIRRAASRIGATPPFAAHLDGWAGPWHFPTARATRERLAVAGFSRVRCWVEEAPYEPEDPRAYLATMVIAPHRERLPAELREPFTDAVMDALRTPGVVDYVRLNVDAWA